jgi:hypothetical protein
MKYILYIAFISFTLVTYGQVDSLSILNYCEKVEEKSIPSRSSLFSKSCLERKFRKIIVSQKKMIDQFVVLPLQNDLRGDNHILYDVKSYNGEGFCVILLDETNGILDLIYCEIRNQKIHSISPVYTSVAIAWFR